VSTFCHTEFSYWPSVDAYGRCALTLPKVAPGFGVVAVVTKRLQIAQVVSASLGQWHDVIDLGRGREVALKFAGDA
jgi:hypothetical protein